MRSDIYSHMEAFVPCNKEALLKRMKKLSLNIHESKLDIPLNLSRQKVNKFGKVHINPAASGKGVKATFEWRRTHKFQQLVCQH